MTGYAMLALDGAWVALLVIVALAAGIGGTLLFKSLVAKAQKAALDQELQAKIATTEAEAQRIRAEAEAEAKSEFLRRREEFDAETKSVRAELRDEEKRLGKREDIIDQKMETLTAKERSVEMADKAVNEKEKSLAAKDRHLNELIAQQKSQLIKVANMSEESARTVLLERVEQDMEHETALLVQRKLAQAEEEVESRSREIIVTSIQRYAAEHTAESTVSTVDIPSDDMKGRVIGREGRNIRAFEKATGVDVIVDDTPGVVVVSGFDPVRREIARLTLEKLISDGRIHPGRIEEVAADTTNEVNRRIVELGKQALLDANIRGVHQKLVTLLGRLHYRTSYGQNVLKHAMEVGYLSQMIADEVGVDGQLARRCGLLHDIGKAVDHEVEGGHPEIGAELAKRYGERDEVVESIGGHHGDIETRFIYNPIVSAADAISASRPGARRETLERYIQRLEKLEEISTSFEGVKQAFAIQAGREVRVMVDAENVDDRLSGKIAHDIAKRIEEEMQYPGEVRVTLIRELRCVEYAR
jgi:ribonuclease Y